MFSLIIASPRAYTDPGSEQSFNLKYTSYNTTAQMGVSQAAYETPGVLEITNVRPRNNSIPNFALLPKICFWVGGISGVFLDCFAEYTDTITAPSQAGTYEVASLLKMTPLRPSGSLLSVEKAAPTIDLAMEVARDFSCIGALSIVGPRLNITTIEFTLVSLDDVSRLSPVSVPVNASEVEFLPGSARVLQSPDFPQAFYYACVRSETANGSTILLLSRGPPTNLADEIELPSNSSSLTQKMIAFDIKVSSVNSSRFLAIAFWDSSILSTYAISNGTIEESTHYNFGFNVSTFEGVKVTLAKLADTGCIGFYQASTLNPAASVYCMNLNVVVASMTRVYNLDNLVGSFTPRLFKLYWNELDYLCFSAQWSGVTTHKCSPLIPNGPAFEAINGFDMNDFQPTTAPLFVVSKANMTILVTSVAVSSGPPVFRALIKDEWSKSVGPIINFTLENAGLDNRNISSISGDIYFNSSGSADRTLT